MKRAIFRENNSYIRLLVSISLVSVAILYSPSSAFAVNTPVTVLQSPTEQRDKYDADLFTGSVTYTHPIELPKGTAGLTPNLSLTYNSLGSRDPGQRNGVGWELSQDYIERDVRFTPGAMTDDTFKLSFQGTSYELIYVASEGTYHTKIESQLNIKKISGSMIRPRVPGLKKQVWAQE